MNWKPSTIKVSVTLLIGVFALLFFSPMARCGFPGPCPFTLDKLALIVMPPLLFMLVMYWGFSRFQK